MLAYCLSNIKEQSRKFSVIIEKEVCHEHSVKIKKSRDVWRKKAVERGKKERYERKERVRIRKERDRYRKRVREAEKELERERRKGTLPACGKEYVVYIALTLFLVARISFRAVSRVLGVLAGCLGMPKAPCPQTVVNWVVRLSLARIRDVRDLSRPVGHETGGDPFSNGFVWMIDTSICLGAGLGLEKTGMPVSSDNTESLFGISKQHGIGGTKDANRIALRMPALCGELTREDARRVLDVSVRRSRHPCPL